MCTINETVLADGHSVIHSVINNDNAKVVTLDNGVCTAFAGVASNKIISLSSLRDRQNRLLIRAVNNRTRERNYFRLYCQLADKEITEEEFETEIDSNGDEYVVPSNTDAPLEDVEAALSVAPSLKGVHSTDDFESLFNIADKSVQQYIECSNNGSIC